MLGMLFSHMLCPPVLKFEISLDRPNCNGLVSYIPRGFNFLMGEGMRYWNWMSSTSRTKLQSWFVA